MKRDALFEALKGIAGVEDSLSALHAVYKTDEESGSERPEERSKAYGAFNNAANDLDRAGLIIGLVCSEHLRNDLLEFCAFSRDIAANVHEGRPHFFIVWGTEFVEKKKKILDAMRKDIEARTSLE